MTTNRQPAETFKVSSHEPNNQIDSNEQISTKEAINHSKTSVPQLPLVVIGSANAEIYFEIDELPKLGETISANASQVLVGGKGVNQAACGGKLCYPTYFIGHVGDDAHGKLIKEALKSNGVLLDYLNIVSSAPTGHALMVQESDGQNSVINVGGANMCFWPKEFSNDVLEVVKNAGIVLLQREIPDSVNIQVAKVAQNAGVQVLMDAGGMERPTPVELLSFVDILISNETELEHLTGMPTKSYEEISQAAAKCLEMGVKKVLVKHGENGSVLYVEGEEAIRQMPISTGNILDTTGAGDTFTAAFAVALVEGKSEVECLTFAGIAGCFSFPFCNFIIVLLHTSHKLSGATAAAASLCIQVKGAMPSMPERKAVLNVLQSL
ncbi:Ribokinase [Thalictrum thalictroides]|uniref:Ribokinase n=1 Tax=Thalictrum thalictroides TaxID=46969 RepID=A0A7J6URL7_THATH|nr:Ribokinase [Thalictrum thalictroides]